MSQENSTSHEEDNFEDDFEGSTPGEKEGSDEASKADGEASDTSLFDRISKETGKTIKTEEDLVKMLKQQAKDFSVKGQQQRKPQESTPRNYAEDILAIRFPEAQHVMDELREEAKRTGKDELEIFKGSTYFQREAKARAEAQKVEEENKSKINSPSGTTKGSAGFDKMSDDDISKMDDETFEKYSEWKASKGR